LSGTVKQKCAKRQTEAKAEAETEMETEIGRTRWQGGTEKVFYYRLSLLFMAHACVFEYFGLAFVFMCVSLFENFSI